ncbi:hypothetical protein DFJ74DRAFT_712198 [Hyaloraphidium curvatum]|nr:hypothetical protein DFJ74DRAFT_712198 [Hyaloraphidium curvatum]
MAAVSSERGEASSLVPMKTRSPPEARRGLFRTSADEVASDASSPLLGRDAFVDVDFGGDALLTKTDALDARFGLLGPVIARSRRWWKPRWRGTRIEALVLLVAGTAIGFALSHLLGFFAQRDLSSTSQAPVRPPVNGTRRRYTLSDAFDPAFPSAGTPGVVWVEWNDRDGYYLVQNATSGDFVLGNAGDGRIWSGKEGDEWVPERDGELRVVLRSEQLPKAADGDSRAGVTSFVPSPSYADLGILLLIETRREKRRRHSHASNYFVCPVSLQGSGSCFPVLGNETSDAANMRIQHAEFHPSSPHLVFVAGNNVHELALPLGQPFPVTNDGSPTVYNGVADWLYEEEIFERTSALWPHPSAPLMAFLRTDVGQVGTVEIPIYGTAQYPETVELRYPKAGTANPSVGMWIWDRGFGGGGLLGRVFGIEEAWGGTDFYVLEAAWYPGELKGDWREEGGAELLLRTADRVQLTIKELLVSWDTGKGMWVAAAVREFAAEDGAWVELGPPVMLGSGRHAFLATRPGDGRQHVALVESPRSKGVDRWITWGSGWDATAIAGFSNGTELVIEATLTPEAYAAPVVAVSGMERHVWTVNLEDRQHGDRPRLRLLSQSDEPPSFPLRQGKSGHSILQSLTGSLSASRHIAPRNAAAMPPSCFFVRRLSPRGEYLPLSYLGPSIPFTEIIRLAGSGARIPGELNAPLRLALEDFDLPSLRTFELPLPATDRDPAIVVSATELRPPGFEPTGATRYRALVRVYGGPASQAASPSFALGFHAALASDPSDPFVVFAVDGRGTFGRGRAFQSAVAGRLGQLEARDVLRAAGELARLPYVDAGRMALWGWSFGGYLTLKVVESDTGFFRAAAAVAPVTDWRLYDSAYAERYLGMPTENASGYEEGIVKGEGQGWARGGTLIAHGTADDNVHFQNAAALLARLVQNGVPASAWRAQPFPDSDHSMAAQGGKATRELYELIMAWFDERLGACRGAGGEEKGS